MLITPIPHMKSERFAELVRRVLTGKQTQLRMPEACTAISNPFGKAGDCIKFHTTEGEAYAYLRVVRSWRQKLNAIDREDVRAHGFGLPVSPGDTQFRDGYSELHSIFANEWDAQFTDAGLGWDNNPMVCCCEFELTSVFTPEGVADATTT